MTCEQWKEFLPRFVFGGLPRALCPRMRRHLRSCPACTRDLEGYRRVIHLARGLGEVSLPGELARRLKDAVAAELRARGAPPNQGPEPETSPTR